MVKLSLQALRPASQSGTRERSRTTKRGSPGKAPLAAGADGVVRCWPCPQHFIFHC